MTQPVETRDNEAMQIFIARDGVQLGAWTEAEVLQFYADGQFLPTDHFWHEGMGEWSRLENLQETAASPLLPKDIPTTAVPDAEPVSSVVRMDRRPSPLIWALPLVGVLLLGVIVVFVLLKRHRAAEALLTQRNNLTAQQHNDEQKQLPSINTASVDQKKVAAPPEQVKVDPTKSMADATLAETQQISTRVKACQAAEEQMLALGLSPSKITSLDELEKRRSAVLACQPPIQDLLAYLKNLDSHSRELLTTQGVAPAQIDGFIDDAARKGRGQALITFWGFESTILTDIMTNLDLFKSSWGKWHSNDRVVVFDDSDALASYNANQKKIQDDVSQQKAAQQQLLVPPSQ